MQGHYQTSHQAGDRLDRHPSGNVDQRIDFDYLETADMGETWITADATVLTTPITDVASPARIRRNGGPAAKSKCGQARTKGSPG